MKVAPWRLMADRYEGNLKPDLLRYRQAGHRRIMFKATEGLHHIDVTHAIRSRLAHDVGLHVVHYHFARPDQGPRPGAEAAAFWLVVKPLWRPGDRLVIDCEPPAGGRWEAPRWYVEELVREVTRLAHIEPAVYGSTSFLKEHLATSWLRKRRRHEAAYGPRPSPLPWRRPWWAWQFTDGTSGPEPHVLAGVGRGDISLLSWRLALGDRFALGGRRKVAKRKAR